MTHPRRWIHYLPSPFTSMLTQQSLKDCIEHDAILFSLQWRNTTTALQQSIIAHLRCCKAVKLQLHDMPLVCIHSRRDQEWNE